MNSYPAMSSSIIPPSNALPDPASGHAVFNVNRVMTEPSTTQSSVIDLTENDDEEPEADRPAKRQRLDTTISRPSHAPNDTASGSVDEFMGMPTVTLSPGNQRWSTGDRMFRADSFGGLENGENAGDSQLVKPNMPLPLPPRPTKYDYLRTRTEGMGRRDQTQFPEVKTTPYTLEIPPTAPRYGDQKPTDFYPWTGTHPEDELTELTAKQGFYDRIQVSQNESNTARPSLYSQLKHRSGLKLLSFVFTAAMEKRQAQSKLVQGSTFKPPPRVTLTDNKREAWLRDLSNPAVPLRRLSRTIPHGIRGKILLDQCLGKGIPVPRAIWLAKCVGANEIRAFKRKGTSPAAVSGLESKWVRDWTLNVQQFLEAALGNHEEADWCARLAYAMALSARLFLDQLLDQDLFLDWFLNSLRASSLEKLPVWLSLLGVYGKSLSRYRKRGRRLAEFLLEKLTLALSDDRPDLLQPLTSRLQSLIRPFAEAHPSCFVLPLTWSRYKPSLVSCFNKDKPDNGAILTILSERNGWVTEIAQESPAQRPAPQQLIKLLDSISPSYDFSILSSECLRLPLDHEALISRVLEWASTPFRHGINRVYIAVRLLRRWRKSEIDTDSHMLSFLLKIRTRPGFELSRIYHIISELIRSQSFSVGKYLQWLMARGAVAQHQNSENPPADVYLLRHIPARRLPEHTWNLRNTLLARTGFSVTSEAERVDYIKKQLASQIPDILPKTSMDNDVTMVGQIDFHNLTWTVKSELTQWIREHFTSFLTNSSSFHNNGQNLNPSTVPPFTPDRFFDIRHMLESMDDLSILADFLKQTSQTSNVTILASAVDTLNYYFASLSAIGAATDLFKSFTNAYSRVSKTEPQVQDFIVSLLDVVVRLPTEISTAAELRRDLVRLDKKYAVAASSPVSDHMADTLNPIDPTFPGMLDQLLASGNSMDDATLVRVFDLLMRKLEHGKTDINISSNGAGKYLYLLRSFNPKTFDTLLVKRVVSVLKSSPRAKLDSFLPPLIGVGCVTFQAFFSLTKYLLKPPAGQQVNVPNVTELQVEMLSLLYSDNFDNTPLDFVSYRYKIARQEYISRYPCDIITFIQDTLEKTSQSSSENQIHVETLWRQDLLPLLCELIVRNTAVTRAQCAKWIAQPFSAGVVVLRQAIDHLLVPETNNDLMSALQEVQQTIERVDDFSLPYCLVKLQLLLAAESEAGARNSILDVLFSSLESDIRAGSSLWVDILTVLDEKDQRQIRQKAENTLISLIVTPSPPMPDSEYTKTPCHETVLVCLRIVEKLIPTVTGDNVSPAMGGTLVEKMNSLLQRIALGYKAKNSGKPDTAEHGSQPDMSNIPLWFYCLLRLAAIHRSAFRTDTVTKSDLTNQTRLIISICCIAFTPSFSQPDTGNSGLEPADSMTRLRLQTRLPETWATLQVCAFDVISTLVDTIPDEARNQCARYLRDRCSSFLHPQSNNRISFLFGPIPDPQVPASPAPAPPTTGQSPNAAAPIPSPAQLQAPQAPTPVINTAPVSNTDYPTSSMNNLRFQQGGRIVGPCPTKAWEMLEEPAPMMGVNDTALNLTYFGTRRVRAELK